jgi:hypothetical protein
VENVGPHPDSQSGHLEFVCVFIALDLVLRRIQSLSSEPGPELILDGFPPRIGETVSQTEIPEHHALNDFERKVEFFCYLRPRCPCLTSDFTLELRSPPSSCAHRIGQVLPDNLVLLLWYVSGQLQRDGSIDFGERAPQLDLRAVVTVCRSDQFGREHIRFRLRRAWAVGMVGSTFPGLRRQGRPLLKKAGDCRWFATLG